jgi:hypothetical protein
MRVLRLQLQGQRKAGAPQRWETAAMLRGEVCRYGNSGWRG